jgi:peptide/nickel transport system ATP-binding protein
MPYTWGLLESIPEVGGDVDKPLIPIPGLPPSMLAPPPGCPFEPRCRFKHQLPDGLCRDVLPDLRPGGRGPGHLKRCHLPDPEAAMAAEERRILDEVALHTGGAATHG